MNIILRLIAARNIAHEGNRIEAQSNIQIRRANCRMDAFRYRRIARCQCYLNTNRRARGRIRCFNRTVQAVLIIFNWTQSRNQNWGFLRKVQRLRYRKTVRKCKRLPATSEQKGSKRVSGSIHSVQHLIRQLVRSHPDYCIRERTTSRGGRRYSRNHPGRNGYKPAISSFTREW